MNLSNRLLVVGLLLSLASLTQPADAQTRFPFGLRDSADRPAAQPATGRFQNLFTRRSDADRAEPNSTAFKFPKLELPTLPKLNSLFPPRETNEPTFFQKWGDFNRELWEKTRSRFSALSKEDSRLYGPRPTSSLDRLSRGFNGTAHRDPPPLQPPLRTATRMTDGRRVRRSP